MTTDQTAAILAVLYDARDLLLAIDRGWVRIEVGEGDSEFVQSLRKSVAHAKSLDMPPPPYVAPEPETARHVDGQINYTPTILNVTVSREFRQCKQQSEAPCRNFQTWNSSNPHARSDKAPSVVATLPCPPADGVARSIPNSREC